ncbi:PREDICTED: uncharacterized protein LOC106816361, partial [Priapulus caudatus]|uniref:Uncharacterized protein LOC106816361 n=1 Tax=Priapulus caudatus TaxID=37621 RepID=A0ABM1EW63_PRICU
MPLIGGPKSKTQSVTATQSLSGSTPEMSTQRSREASCIKMDRRHQVLLDKEPVGSAKSSMTSSSIRRQRRFLTARLDKPPTQKQAMSTPHLERHVFDNASASRLPQDKHSLRGRLGPRPAISDNQMQAGGRPLRERHRAEQPSPYSVSRHRPWIVDAKSRNGRLK